MHRSKDSKSLVPALPAASIALSLAVAPASAQTAGDIMSKLEPEKRYSYVTGVIEGLAIARYQNDKPDVTGMKCIYDWFHSDAKRQWEVIRTWFERHPDQSPGALLFVLTKKECGA
ncbi:hypothetical protein B7H23_07670 [Notoacmeibacter marinus]|uniref:Rap1a immunity protein domain-containing protein n=1 Tax=Notoacmeibacter marinus TaxID=1876515 RepID=A0A231V3H7_9HYPH|nr:hypothetical protein [Notoacmeibacter marinus]OXT02742.1 hypothetical protein B7H23_07670 [Notoacmeibacter marinus]